MHPYDAEMAELRWQFALRFKALRKDRFRTQELFAGRTGLHPTTIGGIEQGNTDPRLSTLLIVSEGLNVPVDALVRDLPVPRERKPRRKPARKRPRKPRKG